MKFWNIFSFPDENKVVAQREKNNPSGLKKMDAQQTLRQFDSLHCALIDASSIIYIQKAGFFDELAEAVPLFSIAEILTEASISDRRIQLIETVCEAQSNDARLICCALRNRLPVISEDKKILQALKRKNSPHFNALMMLNFLWYRQRVSVVDYLKFKNALKKIAWYRPQIWEFGERIFHLNKNDD